MIKMNLRDKRFEVSGRDNQDKNTYEYALWEKDVKEAVLKFEDKLDSFIDDIEETGIVNYKIMSDFREIFGNFRK